MRSHRSGIRGRRFSTAALLLLLPACDSPSTPPADDRLSVWTESEHLVYYAAPGDQVDTVWQEGYYRWVTAALQVSPGQKLEFRKYRNREHIKRLTGRETNGFAEPGTIRFHTIWPIDNHEMVHTLVILGMGHPPALFNEGIAVAHQTIPAEAIFYAQWNRRNVHAISAEHLAAGRLPPLDRLIASRDFFEESTELTYPISGSFVRFLIDHHGLARMRAYLQGRNFEDGAAATRAAFQAAYGLTLDAAWAEWRAFLASPQG
jgi:hypothetical protein